MSIRNIVIFFTLVSALGNGLFFSWYTHSEVPAIIGLMISWFVLWVFNKEE